MVGHIKIDRKILNWEWYSDQKVFHFFLYILLKANYKDSNYRGVEIKRGQLLTGTSKIAKETGLTEREIRTVKTKLIETGEMTVKTTNKYSIITICKYDTYQKGNYISDTQNDQQNVTQTTGKATTSNNIINKEDNNINRNIPEGVSPSPLMIYPKKEQYNGLPQLHYENLCRLVKATKNIEIDKDQVDAIWEVFKEQNLTGLKAYNNDQDVYRHFTNWGNKQSFRKKPTPKEPKIKEQVIGVEFINDFTQVKMSDGSVKDLTVNQKTGAKFNQINPSSIKK